MKKCTRILALLLALVLTLGLAVTAYADGTTTGTITIDNAVVGQTYTIYEILHLESYNAGSNAYAYKATTDWEAFIKGTDINDVYVKVDDQGYVTWVKDADPAAFAKLAQAYAAKKTLTNQWTTVATSKTVTFTGLDLGYYLLDSSLGTLCSLDTTNPTVTIEEKNAVPTNEKKVEEDSTGAYGNVNDADIGQTVNFKSTITAQAGAENYVFEDTMSAGLTYNKDAKVYTDETMTEELNSSYYTVNNNPGDGNTFTITFEQSYLNTITAETKLYVKYSAVLNKDAKIGVEGNENKSTLKYGDATNPKSTPESKTTTYTWDLDVLKYGNNDKRIVLKDAQFVLLNYDRSKVATVVDGKITGWVEVPNPENGTWPANTVLTTGENGKIEIDGLDSDTYCLREVKAPAGYNKLKEDVKVEVAGATKGEDGTTLNYTTVVAEVNNQSGTELPSTGGMGTTIFYVLGGILAVGAAVLLVTKKRMERA